MTNLIVTGTSQSLDIQIGRRVRWCRQRCGWTQTKLAQRLSVIVQQVQKYECGASALTASRLHQLSALFNVPVSFFFDGYKVADSVPAIHGVFANLLTRACQQIDDPDLQRLLLPLVRALNGHHI